MVLAQRSSISDCTGPNIGACRSASAHANTIANAARTRRRIATYGPPGLFLRGSSAVATLPDGIYDVIVVDAQTTDEGDVRLELTITVGAHAGRLVALRRRHVAAPDRVVPDATALLGVPGTLRVRDKVPSFRPERA
jgi:hypothetical protein